MARYRLLRTSFTGTTQYFLAMFRGTYWASSTGMEMAVRSTKVHAQLHSQSVDELRLRDEAVLDQCVAQPLLGLLLECQSTLQLLPCDGPGRHQQIAQAHIGHFTHLPVEDSPVYGQGKTAQCLPANLPGIGSCTFVGIIYLKLFLKSTDFS